MAGLGESYELLQDLGSEAGREVFATEEFKHLLGDRNDSFLAHGFRPISGTRPASSLASSRPLPPATCPGSTASARS